MSPQFGSSAGAPPQNIGMLPHPMQQIPSPVTTQAQQFFSPNTYRPEMDATSSYGNNNNFGMQHMNNAAQQNESKCMGGGPPQQFHYLATLGGQNNNNNNFCSTTTSSSNPSPYYSPRHSEYKTMLAQGNGNGNEIPYASSHLQQQHQNRSSWSNNNHHLVDEQGRPSATSLAGQQGTDYNGSYGDMKVIDSSPCNTSRRSGNNDIGSSQAWGRNNYLQMPPHSGRTSNNGPDRHVEYAHQQRSGYNNQGSHHRKDGHNSSCNNNVNVNMDNSYCTRQQQKHGYVPNADTTLSSHQFSPKTNGRKYVAPRGGNSHRQHHLESELDHNGGWGQGHRKGGKICSLINERGHATESNNGGLSYHDRRRRHEAGSLSPTYSSSFSQRDSNLHHHQQQQQQQQQQRDYSQNHGPQTGQSSSIARGDAVSMDERQPQEGHNKNNGMTSPLGTCSDERLDTQAQPQRDIPPHSQDSRDSSPSPYRPMSPLHGLGVTTINTTNIGGQSTITLQQCNPQHNYSVQASGPGHGQVMQQKQHHTSANNDGMMDGAPPFPIRGSDGGKPGQSRRSDTEERDERKYSKAHSTSYSNTYSRESLRQSVHNNNNSNDRSPLKQRYAPHTPSPTDTTRARTTNEELDGLNNNNNNNNTASMSSTGLRPEGIISGGTQQQPQGHPPANNECFSDLSPLRQNNTNINQDYAREWPPLSMLPSSNERRYESQTDFYSTSRSPLSKQRGGGGGGIGHGPNGHHLYTTTTTTTSSIPVSPLGKGGGDNIIYRVINSEPLDRHEERKGGGGSGVCPSGAPAAGGPLESTSPLHNHSAAGGGHAGDTTWPPNESCDHPTTTMVLPIRTSESCHSHSRGQDGMSPPFGLNPNQSANTNTNTNANTGMNMMTNVNTYDIMHVNAHAMGNTTNGRLVSPEQEKLDATGGLSPPRGQFTSDFEAQSSFFHGSHGHMQHTQSREEVKFQRSKRRAMTCPRGSFSTTISGTTPGMRKPSPIPCNSLQAAIQIRPHTNSTPGTFKKGVHGICSHEGLHYGDSDTSDTDSE